MSRFGRLLRDLLVVAVIIAGFRYFQTRELPSGPAPSLVGTGLSGETVSLERFRGEPVIVYFWASWCGVCRAMEGNVEGLADVKVVRVAVASGKADAVARASELRERAYVVDLAWLRSTPWRERVAATFDPPQWRPELARISAVTVRFRPDSLVAAVLLVGWLARRLGWRPGGLTEPDEQGRCSGTAEAPDGPVELRFEPDPTMPIPGLAGLTVETRSGMGVSLDRGPGGLNAGRRAPDGHESSWTVMGASRGEAGILGEGIRQALLREHGYTTALGVARELVG